MRFIVLIHTRIHICTWLYTLHGLLRRGQSEGPPMYVCTMFNFFVLYIHTKKVHTLVLMTSTKSRKNVIHLFVVTNFSHNQRSFQCHDNVQLKQMKKKCQTVHFIIKLSLCIRLAVNIICYLLSYTILILMKRKSKMIFFCQLLCVHDD